MKKLILTYNIIITLILGVIGFTQAKTNNEYIFAALFIPLSYYFFTQLLKQLKSDQVTTNYAHAKQKSLIPLKSELTESDQAIEGEIVEDPTIKDIDRRLFLKLIGSGSFTIFLMSLFTKKTHAAFFGSVPGPGTVAVKDSTGNVIDPAEKQPTDGYEITELDESDPTYSYYGFVHKDGPWYIARETKATGSYRYTNGASNFSTGWTNRATPSIPYNYFDVIFS